MSSTVIRVDRIGKRYRVGAEAGGLLRDKLAGALRDPVGLVRRKKKETFWALKDISFEVREGEVLGLIGRNGAGKSTLLKVLARITKPTVGHAEIHGRVGSLLEVGTGFHPELTGRENVFLNGAILGMGRREITRKFDEIVAFAEVEKFLDTAVKHYSSGMYVRLAFAVAAHLETEVLFVDEVLSVGDAAFQKKCLGKMGEVAHQGRTIVFVSHNMVPIRSLCSRIIWLAHGRIVQTGSVNVITSKYLTEIDEQASLEADFSKVERFGHYGRQLRINRVRINRGEGIWHGKPLVAEFSFECLDDVEDVSFAIGFCNREGGRIMTFDSDLPGARWTMKRGQKGTANLYVPELLLEPDFYTIDYGARSGDNGGLEYFPQSAQVTVLPSDVTPAVIAMRESGRGGVRFPGEWDLVLEQAHEVQGLRI